MQYCSWDTARNRCNCYFSFWTVFCPFTPQQPEKWKFQNNEKNAWRWHLLHKCTKSYDHMVYCSWDMEHDRCNYFSFWDIFCPFTPLTAQKIKISKKWKKNAWRYHHFTYVYQKLWSDVWFLRNGARRTDGRTDGRTEKVTHRGGCPI